MKNHVSFETAKRLEAAGFPKPKPEFGQAWYDEDGAYVIGSVSGKLICGSWQDGDSFSDASMDGDIFAPTVIDILQELDGYVTDGETCYFVNAANELVNEYLPKNPAEAAAAAWLSINEKQPA